MIILFLGKKILGSSGFEHVFLGEKKNGAVQGLKSCFVACFEGALVGFHNWVYFHHLEKQNKLNYLGHWRKVVFAGRGTGLTFTFKWGDEQKPFASMMIGKFFTSLPS